MSGSRGYIVVIAIKNQWWSDQKRLPNYVAAQRHRRTVAEQWNDCDTAIVAPDGRLLNFQESLLEKAEFARLSA